MFRIVKSPTPPLACAALALAALAALGQSTPPNSSPARPAPATSSQPAAPPPAAARTPSADDPSLRTPTQLSPEDLLKEFQKDRPRALPILPSGGPDEVVVERETPASSGGRRLPDGFFLVDRVGRLTRDGEWWVFVFEGYNDSHPEPPMRLLPNQLLERMVIESEGAGGSAVFVGSGEVTEFKGENYLLLRKLLLRRGLGNLEK
jgi:hypothetical protein